MSKRKLSEQDFAVLKRRINETIQLAKEAIELIELYVKLYVEMRDSS